jgi:hypothetical protein
MLDSSARLLAMVVDRRSIAKALAKIWPHSVEHVRENRRGSVIVEVNAAHHSTILQAFVRWTPATTFPKENGASEGAMRPLLTEVVLLSEKDHRFSIAMYWFG